MKTPSVDKQKDTVRAQGRHRYQLNVADLAPNIEDFPLTEFPNELNFFSFQSQSKQVLEEFLQLDTQRLLVLQTENMAEYAPFVEGFIESFYQKNHATKIDKFYYQSERTETGQTVFTRATQSQAPEVVTGLYIDSARLFGKLYFDEKHQQGSIQLGMVQEASGGVLMLNVAEFLNNFRLWQRLKSLLVTQNFVWQGEDMQGYFPYEIADYPLNLKVILFGTREELASFHDAELNLYHLADYSELEQVINLTQSDNANKWFWWVQCLADAQEKRIENDAINLLYQQFVRETESKNWVSLSPWRIAKIFQQSAFKQEQDVLDKEMLRQYFIHKDKQQSQLREQSYQAILQDQVYIATDGEVVGQINGLSVVEYAGVPKTFGEPVRISCLVQFGDGEVIDIERKNELAGNVHSKGLMIAESCLANVLHLPAQLPFSATVAFEQSYGEIDGDSASLACFLSLVSSLADEPLPQSIAVTGAIDQFGCVHTVGGVNDKVEGFFAICKARGLTGKQGVIIPKATLEQLSLSDELQQAVADNAFSLWAVSDINQACEIMFEQPLLDEKLTGSLVDKIHHRFGENSDKGGLFARLFRR
ncbi:AAA family ATPase [Actinobacillus delphinicola]|uniref:endopeptidase La n=1 Tax=Actinobacillus delphinicola TaxID=51161 RepID=A0A448TVW0_9PAST|nr:AAA family ATPase [Actinobacillus delphinicola]VEJ10078.1 ATP-dependent protease [Actinobacillus delphinicola]